VKKKGLEFHNISIIPIIKIVLIGSHDKKKKNITNKVDFLIDQVQNRNAYFLRKRKKTCTFIKIDQVQNRNASSKLF
jgi:hypothetical protein